MPKIKINAKAQEHKTGFEAYAGAQPDRPGAYRGRVKQLRWREYAKGSAGFNVLVELEADAKAHPEQAQYDGAPFWRNIVAVAQPGEELKDGSQRSLETFLAALGVSGDVDDVDVEEGDAKRAVNVRRIGKKNAASLLGVPVIVDMRIDAVNSDADAGRTVLEINNIRPAGEKAVAGPMTTADAWATDVVPEEDEDDEAAEDDGDASDELAERETELKALKVAELRKVAVEEYDLDTKGLGKQQLIDAILEHEFEPMATEEDDSEEPEEDDDDAEIEVEEDEEDEPEDEQGAIDARAQELAELDRTALKAVLKALDEERKVFKSTTDDQIRTWILEREFTDAEASDLPF